MVLLTIFVEDDSIMQSYLRLCKPHGVFVVVGAPIGEQNLFLDVNYLKLKSIKVAGTRLGSGNDLHEMMQFVADYKIRPIIKVFKFNEFPAAFKKVQKMVNPVERMVVDLTQE